MQFKGLTLPLKNSLSLKVIPCPQSGAIVRYRVCRLIPLLTAQIRQHDRFTAIYIVCETRDDVARKIKVLPSTVFQLLGSVTMEAGQHTQPIRAYYKVTCEAN